MYQLYMLNENVYNACTTNHHHHRKSHAASAAKQLLDFHRTNSADAINTGCKGLVRSKDWLNNSELKEANEGN